MTATEDFLRDQVQRLNSALSQYQNRLRSQPTTAVQGEDTRRAESPAPWVSDRSIMAPLVAEYDRHMAEMSDQLQRYQTQMADVKLKLERVVKENGRLHAELRESVEKQLQALPGGLEGDVLGEEGLVKNLQEQIQLSLQEREQAVELCQASAQEVDRLQRLYQTTVSDGQLHVAERQRLKDQLTQFQQHTQKVQVANQKLESTNQQFVKTVTEQSIEMEELRCQLRQTKADLRTATAKVEETTKLMQNVQDQMQRREDEATEAYGREEASDRRVQQLQSALSQLEARLKAASAEAESGRRQQAAWERQAGELQGRCASLEEERYEILAKIRETAQLAEEAGLHKDQALLREKQKADELENVKQAIKQLIHDAAVRTRKEVENVRKQCNVQIHRMAEELSALQLECADKESQIERCLRERKAVEEELEKVYKEGRGEPEYRKMEALHQRCLNAERLKEDTSITLQTTQNKMKKMEMDHGEEVSRWREEAGRLAAALAAAREDSAGLSEERLQLQRENQQLRTDMEALRKNSLLAQRRARTEVSQKEQEYQMKEQALEARLSELEQSGRSSGADLTRLLTAQRRAAQRWKDEATTLTRAFQDKLASLRTELNRQKQRSQELELQLEADHETIVEYERQVTEYQEKNGRLQRRLTQAEHRAATVAQQLNALTSHRRKTSSVVDPKTV